jgi:hypothetical protein
MFSLEDTYTMQDVEISTSGSKCDPTKTISISGMNGVAPFKIKNCITGEVVLTTANAHAELDEGELIGLISDFNDPNVCFVIEDSNDPPCSVTKNVAFPEQHVSLNLTGNIPTC